MKTATCCQEKCQTTEQKSAQQKLSTTLLCQELAAPSRRAVLAGGWRAAGLELGDGRPVQTGLGVKLQCCPAHPPLGLPLPLPASSSLLGSGWVLGKSCPLPSANLQGPGSMGTVRLVQNMCKMIFFTSKVERHPFDKGPFGEGYRRKLRVPFVPKATAGSWHRA